MTVKFVSKEKYDAIVAKTNEANALRQRSKSPDLTLAAKVALQRQAKAIETEVDEMVRPPADYDGPVKIID